VASGLDESVRQPDTDTASEASDRRPTSPLYDLDTVDQGDRGRLARLRAYDQPNPDGHGRQDERDSRDGHRHTDW
jgi:hypothetical protein